ncbi:pentatricopeptide repeat-containing protein At4g33990-like [Trifolium pratense]|nr:pentatricopeptide repeat-containing protein At4g33990-like [Trifolium pratense]
MSRKLLSSLLRSCTTHSTTSQCHAQTILQSLLPNVILQTDILLAYTKLGLMAHARKLFDKMPQRNMHSWNIMIASYTHSSLYFDAVTVFKAFKQCGSLPDHYTLPPLFKISIGIGKPCFGWMCHGLVVKLGYEEIVVVTNSVLEFYIKCGTVSQALSVFSNHNAHRDSVTWNLMISGFGKAGLYSDAVHCFREMLKHQSGYKLDYMTLPSILSACGKEGDMLKLKEVHGFIVRNFGFHADAPIGNALIDNYGKCGSLNDSENIFKTVGCVNLVTWTTMISCYGMHGKGEESVFLFEKMMDEGFRPNAVTLTAILASCSHSGLLDQGKKIFSSMISDYGFEPTAEHYACMVDLLGRCGYLEEALRLLKRMKSSSVTGSMWGALLAGCVMHKNVEIGEVAAHQLFQLEPNNTSNYVALCGIYRSLGMARGVSTVRAKMRGLSLVKTPGCSWINIAGRAHKFYQGDLSHPLSHMIFQILYVISNTQLSTNDLGVGYLLHDDDTFVMA